MRLLKWIFGLLITVVVLVAAAVVFITMFFDPNDYKTQIVEAVEAQTGRSFDLAGDISLGFFPSLAIEAGPAELGNDPAFSDQQFLRAERVAAGVALLPLISRQIRVGEVVLDGVEINLEVDSNGRGNWESLLTAAESSATEPAPDSGETALPDLSVEAVRLVNARISYRDAASGLDARLTDLSISVAPISADATTRLELETQYAVDAYAGTIAAKIDADGLLSGSGPRLRLEFFEISNTAGIGATVATEKPATVDLAAGTASLPGLIVTSGDLRIVLAAEAQAITDRPVASGTLTVEPFDLGAWLESNNFYTAGTADPDAMSRLGLSTAFRFSDDVLALTSVQGELDETTLSGTASVGEVITFELAVDAIDVDRYLPPASDVPAPETDPGTAGEAPALPKISGSMKVGRLAIAGMEATGIELTVEADESGLAVTPIRGNFYQGTINAALRLDTAENPGQTAVEVSVDSMQAGPMFEALAGQPVMTGTGNLQARIALADAFAVDPLAGLGGQVSLKFADGAVYGFNVVGSLRQALALMGKGDPAALDKGDLETDFSSFDFAGRIEQGILETEVFNLASPYLRVNGSGRINLVAGTVDYRIEPLLIGAPEGQGSELAELEGMQIPVTLVGTLAAPKVNVDIAAALLSSQRGRIEDAIQERLGVKSEGDDEEGGSKALLRGLLQNALDDKKKKDDDSGDGGSR